MNPSQDGILAPLPPLARYAFFQIRPGADPAAALRRLVTTTAGEDCVVGFGASLTAAFGYEIPGLEVMPADSFAGVDLPSTPDALCCWLRGDDRGELLHRCRTLERVLAPAFAPSRIVDAFMHAGGRDLSGYEDGTENPQDEAAEAAALVRGAGAGLDGSSFVAIQQWVHDFAILDAMSPAAQNAMMGRDKESNAELDDAPESAHVKRTAQENYEPPAFMLRRSMPWTDGPRGGLMFVAFGHSFAAFAAQMRRMSGHDDGITDALFAFTRPISGGYFWCPPLRDGRLDLSRLGL